MELSLLSEFRTGFLYGSLLVHVVGYDMVSSSFLLSWSCLFSSPPPWGVGVWDVGPCVLGLSVEGCQASGLKGYRI